MQLTADLDGRPTHHASLILADDCNPEWPSLPLVGYKAARAIADHADVVVATHVRNRDSIEKGIRPRSVRYIDNEYIARPAYKLATWLRRGTETAWTTAMALKYPSYLAFEWEVWKATRDELRKGEFDLVHRITPMSPRYRARWRAGLQFHLCSGCSTAD